MAHLGMCLIAVSITLAGTSFPSSRSACQRPPEISGVIMDSLGIPIAFARVQGAGLDPRITDDSGRFRVTMRKAGGLTLQVRRVGFGPLEVTLNLNADTTIRLVMAPLAASLATVRIEAEGTVQSLEFRGFYDRLRERVRGTNTGHFITPEEIESRKGALKVAQIVQGIPSLRVVRVSTSRGRQSYETLAGRGGCPMMIYVDGQRLNNLGGGVQQGVNLDWLPTTREIAGIEVYTGANAPSQFQSFALNCGVVLVWTK